MSNWNSPETKPTQPGEYRAALDPSDTSPTNIRRWWNGRDWSNPYSANWSAELKEKIRNEISSFVVFWQPV